MVRTLGFYFKRIKCGGGHLWIVHRVRYCSKWLHNDGRNHGGSKPGCPGPDGSGRWGKLYRYHNNAYGNIEHTRFLELEWTWKFPLSLAKPGGVVGRRVRAGGYGFKWLY